MDCIDFRISGELSDIRILVDDSEFNLHKFPLYVRSNYFKNSASKIVLKDQTDKLTVRLDNFPGGSKVFALIADYCYNKDVNVDAENAILVKCAAEYLEMNSNGKGGLCMFADNIIFDLLYLAKSKRDCKGVLTLINEALKYREISERCKLNLRLLDSLVDYLSLSIKLNSGYNSVKLSDFLNDDDVKLINNLPLNWFMCIIKPKLHINSYIALLSSIIQGYIDYNTDLNSASTSTVPKSQEQHAPVLESLLHPLQIDIQVANEVENAKNDDNLSLIKTSSPAISPIPSVQEEIMNSNDAEKSETPVKTNDTNIHRVEDIIRSKQFSDEEKVDIIRQIATSFNQSYFENQFSLSWLLIYMNILNRLNADNDLKLIFIKWIWQSFSHLKKASDELNSLPVETMLQLVKNITSREDVSNQNLERVIDLIDNYLLHLQNNKKLTTDNFIEIVKTVPSEKRNSFDNIAKFLLEILEKDNFNIGIQKQQELLDLIDFHKLGEKTLDTLKSSNIIPHKYITEAALALCAKLRKDLDEQKGLVKALEMKSNYPNVVPPTTTTTAKSVSLLNDYYKSSKSLNTSSSYDIPLDSKQNGQSSSLKSKETTAKLTQTTPRTPRVDARKYYEVNENLYTNDDDDDFDDHVDVGYTDYLLPNYDDILYSHNFYYTPTYCSSHRPRYQSYFNYDNFKY